MAVMRGAYGGRPYEMSVPVMNDRGALPSPGGRYAADLARMAILLLLHLAESYSVFNTMCHTHRHKREVWIFTRAPPFASPRLRGQQMFLFLLLTTLHTLLSGVRTATE